MYRNKFANALFFFVFAYIETVNSDWEYYRLSEGGGRRKNWNTTKSYFQRSQLNAFLFFSFFFLKHLGYHEMISIPNRAYILYIFFIHIATSYRTSSTNLLQKILRSSA